MLYTYDPKQLVISFDGYTLKDIADGTFLVVERVEDSFKPYVGANGEESRSKSNNTSGTAKITLTHVSPDNQFLTNILKRDEQFGTGVGGFLAKDANGLTYFSAQQAYIIKPASASFAKEIGTREWTLRLVKLEMFDAGLLASIVSSIL